MHRYQRVATNLSPEHTIRIDSVRVRQPMALYRERRETESFRAFDSGSKSQSVGSRPLHPQFEFLVNT